MLQLAGCATLHQRRLDRLGHRQGVAVSIRSALFILGILVGGAALIAVGGFGAIMLLTGQQCGGSSYLCNPTADADHAPAEHRLGSR
jgi:hypothetical protein